MHLDNLLRNYSIFKDRILSEIDIFVFKINSMLSKFISSHITNHFSLAFHTLRDRII